MSKKGTVLGKLAIPARPMPRAKPPRLKDPNSPDLTTQERDKRLLAALERAFKAAKGT